MKIFKTPTLVLDLNLFTPQTPDPRDLVPRSMQRSGRPAKTIVNIPKFRAETSEELSDKFKSLGVLVSSSCCRLRWPFRWQGMFYDCQQMTAR